MKEVIGTKLILALPMTRAEYNDYRGWELPADEDGSDAGYLVEYPGGGTNMAGHDGYVSWSPEEQLLDSYQGLDAMSFGHAIEMLKRGRKVARKGWNGKGMWLVLVSGTYVETKEGTPYSDAGLNEVQIDAHIDMYTAGGTMQPGWLASQADMLANDWQVVD